jgi:acetyl esterase
MIKILNISLIYIVLQFFSISSIAQEEKKYDDVTPVDTDTAVVYKTIGEVSLSLYFYYPEKWNMQIDLPAMVFFFGGGWNAGSVTQFEPHARHFSKLGIVCVLADYRVKTRHNTTPFDAVSDAKSALRYLKKNAGEFHIDPERLIASGGSAGGHLAAATAFIRGLNDPGDDLSVSPVPAALVLFNPVIDNGPEGYGYERVKDRYPEISPAHNISAGAPPTIFFLGTKDDLIPVTTAEKFKADMEKAGNRCDLFLYEGQKHGFFNFRNLEYYEKTVRETETFLRSLGYLK